MALVIPFVNHVPDERTDAAYTLKFGSPRRAQSAAMVVRMALLLLVSLLWAFSFGLIKRLGLAGTFASAAWFWLARGATLFPSPSEHCL